MVPGVFELDLSGNANDQIVEPKPFEDVVVAYRNGSATPAAVSRPPPTVCIPSVLCAADLAVADPGSVCARTKWH
jgi:hypothetical protein